MASRKDFFSGILSKLTVLMGGATLLTGTAASATSIPVLSPESHGISIDVVTGRKPLPAKLTLKQKINGFTLIAAHGSHSSHTSHGSHGSHSSHSSRAV